MFRRLNNIICQSIQIFLYNNGFYKNNLRHVQGNEMQHALSPLTPIFWFISDETTYQNKSWCLILSVDRFCYLFCIKWSFIGIFIFQFSFQNGRQRSCDCFFNYWFKYKFYILTTFCESFTANGSNDSGDTLSWTHIPLIFRSPWNMPGTEVLVVEVLGSESVKIKY